MLPKRKVPWKSILYAVGLFVMGTALLLCGCLIHVGKVDNEKYGDRLWPLIIFGLLMFIPGLTFRLPEIGKLPNETMKLYFELMG